MRVLVIGAGAIGGYLAARLAAGGVPVAVVARGEHLRAIQRSGLTLHGADGSTLTARVDAYAHPESAPPSDVVLITLKAHQVPAMAPAIAAASRSAELVIPVHNGVGWWYLQGHPGPHAGRAIEAVDPGGGIARALPLARIAPMYAFVSAEVTAPGCIGHLVAPTDHFPIGPLHADAAAAVQRWCEVMEGVGLRTAVRDARQLMWFKLLGNVFANPICALTGSTLGPVVAHPRTRALAIDLMRETTAVAAAHGDTVEPAYEQRLTRTAEMGAARPSMLQDRLAGRPMELGAILGAVSELGALAGVATPRIDTLLACLEVLAEMPSQDASTPTGVPSSSERSHTP